jgi:hypothetical protein
MPISLTLSKDLERRASAAANELGMSTHAFMAEAILQAVLATEIRTEFAQAKGSQFGSLRNRAGFDVAAFIRKRLCDPSPPSTSP